MIGDRMATYIYETIPQKKGQKPRRFELEQKMSDPALTHDPKTGLPVRRVITGGQRPGDTRDGHPLDEPAEAAIDEPKSGVAGRRFFPKLQSLHVPPASSALALLPRFRRAGR
jgi:hypothetical protein